MTIIGELPVFNYNLIDWKIFKNLLTQYFLEHCVTEDKHVVFLLHMSHDTYNLMADLADPMDVEDLNYDEMVLLLDNHFKKGQIKNMAHIGRLPVFNHKRMEWKVFKSRLNQYLIANYITHDKHLIVLVHLGHTSYNLMADLCYPIEVEDLHFDEMMSLFDNYFKREFTFEDKVNFYTAKKRPTESFRDWVARLRLLARYCEFGPALQTNLRDRFVLGLNPGAVRDTLFQLNPATLPLARALEISDHITRALAHRRN